MVLLTDFSNEVGYQIVCIFMFAISELGNLRTDLEIYFLFDIIYFP